MCLVCIIKLLQPDKAGTNAFYTQLTYSHTVAGKIITTSTSTSTSAGFSAKDMQVCKIL